MTPQARGFVGFRLDLTRYSVTSDAVVPRFGSRGAQSPVRLLGKPDRGMDAHFDVDGVQ